MTHARHTQLVAVALCASLTGLAGASPAAEEAAGVKALEVREVSDRLIQRTGRPSLVVLYATTCPLSRRVFPSLVSLAAEYRERGVDVFAFSVDKESTADRVPAFLASHGAHFAAVRVRPWQSGALTSAMRPVGIQIGRTWTAPLMAVRDRYNRVVVQQQAVTDLAEVREALSQLTR